VTFLVQALLACFLTALFIVVLRRPAIRFGLIDHPGGRKRHGDNVPLTGGLSISVGFFVALAISFRALGDYRVFFVSLAMLAAIGVLDDSGEVSPRSKLGVQVLAALLMTSWGGHFLTSLGDLFGRGPIDLAHWAIPLTVFATVAVINGINMFDGLDGLAGGLAASILAFFSGFAWWMGDVYALKLMVVMLGAVFGFLLFNAPHPWRGRRRTFMGDTGSLVLGFAVAWFSIGLTQRTGMRIPPVLMLWVISIVLFDVFTVTVRRIVRRRDPASPDRAHLHHILLRWGYSPTATTVVIVLANAMLGAAGTLAWGLGASEPALFAAFIAIGLAYVGVFLYPARLLRRMRRRNARAG
jgi:UDP-GlcNAc:undecaprenyl-phosphate GlcNAc-1-phosphate transferase